MSKLRFNRNKPPAQRVGNGHAGNGHAGNGHAGKAPAKVVTGRNVAHAPRTKTERAFLALDIARGHTVVVLPTITQAAKLANVNLDYVHKAARLTAAERHAVEIGRRSICQKMLALPAPAPAVINDAWHRMNAAEREQWVRDNAPELWSALDVVTTPQRAVEDVVEEEGDRTLDPFADADPRDFENPLPEGM